MEILYLDKELDIAPEGTNILEDESTLSCFFRNKDSLTLTLGNDWELREEDDGYGLPIYVISRKGTTVKASETKEPDIKYNPKAEDKDWGKPFHGLICPKCSNPVTITIGLLEGKDAYQIYCCDLKTQWADEKSVILQWTTGEF